MIFFLALVQLFFSVVIGLYFLNQLRSQREGKNAKSLDSGRERGRLLKMREIHLTTPLSEKARPGRLDDVIGQEEGIRALKAARAQPPACDYLWPAGHRQNLRGPAGHGAGEGQS